MDRYAIELSELLNAFIIAAVTSSFVATVPGSAVGGAISAIADLA